MNQCLGSKLGVIVALICLLAASAAHANDRQLRITSGDRASGLFQLAGAVADATNNAGSIPGVNLTASTQISPSAHAALAKLRSGAVEAAVVPDTVAYTAFGGDAQRRTRGWEQLRGLASLSVRPMVILVRGDQEVLSLASLRGWRIAVGPRGSDINGSITALLAAMGLLPEFYNAVHADMDVSAFEQISTGRADAVVLLAAELALPERNGLFSGALKLYSPGKLELERAAMAYPFLRREIVDLGIGRRYATLMSSSTLVARADLPAPVVKTLLLRLWLGDKALAGSANAARNLPAPLHTAALSFYQEHKLMESSRATP